MDIQTITKIACFYILIASGETLNGIARTVYLNKRVGIMNAKRVSMLSALAICLIISYLYVPTIGVTTDNGLLYLGISLSAFMLMFDIILGRYVFKAKWLTIAAEFNILKGNLLGIGMIVMAFCPVLSSRIPHIF